MPTQGSSPETQESSAAEGSVSQLIKGKLSGVLLFYSPSLSRLLHLLLFPFLPPGSTVCTGTLIADSAQEPSSQTLLRKTHRGHPTALTLTCFDGHWSALIPRASRFHARGQRLQDGLPRFPPAGNLCSILLLVFQFCSGASDFLFS